MMVNYHCIICFTGEKIVKPVCSSQLLPRNCDHQKLCSIIKTVLGLMGELLVFHCKFMLFTLELLNRGNINIL